MINDLLYSLPSWLLASLISAIITAYGVVGLLLVERWVSVAERRRLNEVAGPVINVVGMVFAVLIAFIAVNVWQQFSQAGSIVQREANAAADVWRQAYGYPEPLRTHARVAMRRYLEMTISQEWPVQARGGTDDTGWRLIEKLHTEMLLFEPKTLSQRLVHAEQIHDMNSLLDERRNRVHAAGDGIGAAVWMVMIAGTALTIGSMWFFGAQYVRDVMAMTVVVCVSISFVIFLIVGMDYPFRGQIGVGPESLVQALENIKRLQAEEALAAR